MAKKRETKAERFQRHLLSAIEATQYGTSAVDMPPGSFALFHPEPGAWYYVNPYTVRHHGPFASRDAAAAHAWNAVL